MNIQFFDDLSNFLRVSFLLFHSIFFYHFIRWRKIIKPQFDKNIVKFFFIIVSLNVILNSIILLRNLTEEYYFYLIALNIAIISLVVFYENKKIFNLKFYYLLFALLFVLIFLFKESKILISLGLFLIGVSYFHVVVKKEVLENKELYVFLGLYIIFLAVYIVYQSLLINFLATLSVFLSLSLRTKIFYEEKIKAYLIYFGSFVSIVSILLYLSWRYIEHFKNIDIYHKQLSMHRISFEINDKINFYSNLIRHIASSYELKDKINKGSEELNKYLSYLNQIFDTNLVWFIDKNGKVKACSAEHRKTMINQDVSFRRYFKESMQGKLSVFIGRGLYTEKDDIRISYPVYEGEKIIGVLVFQFDISKNFKKQMNIENIIMAHSSGGVLIGTKELRNRLLFDYPPEELKKVYEEKIFGKDILVPSGFKKINENLLEDFQGKRWIIVKHEINKEWWLLSFVNLSFYMQLNNIFHIIFIFITLFSHSIAVRSLEKFRNIVLNLVEETEEKKITLDSLNTGVIYTDFEGKIKYLNKEARRLLEPSENPIGKQLKDLLNLKENEHSKYKVLKLKDKEIPVIYTENPVLIKNTKFGDVITIQDATEIIKTQELSKRLERMDILTKISAGIVHDFNNYLMVLTGNLSLLKELETSPDKRKNIEIMLETTKIMATIIQNLRDLSPDFIRKKEKINIVEVVKHSAEFVLNGTDVRYTIESEPKVFYIYADKTQLYRVFQNIIMNSKQAMQNKGKIEIKIQNYINQFETKDLKKGNYVCITIKDSGPGIPPEYIDKIFDPFFTMRKEGRGLGLTVVKNVIEKLQGKIEVESRLGEGTTFRIYIAALEDI
ncbi:MAG: ATP-binding protein [Thermodesulfovibrio sp.]|nr:ATP-binding protein [Thermodesulfovibrio sp.]MCX7724909.1 ATP-binding protein [Thermodesulfovibrio sp.]MDW7972313.1 ATP-binding protein [Thermodesulfovibrio sp.]